MNYTVKEVKQFVEDNDVKFIKLTFCDTFGNQKNVSIVKSELDAAFTSGVAFDASVFEDFASLGKPLYLFPDPSTLYVLPWRPQSGRVVGMLCDVKHADGTPFEGDSRRILKTAVDRLKNYNLDVKFGTACEFYVLKTDEDGTPAFIPYDNAGYCDVAPIDRCENIRRDIIFSMESMGIVPVSSNHERGKGQNRITFKPADPMTAAKNMLIYKSAVRNICVHDGVYATFMPKPFEDDCGSGLHVSISVGKSGSPVTFSERNELGTFTEGVLKRIKEITAFTNPSCNSYARFASLEAAENVAWSDCDSGSLVRVVGGTNPGIVLRSPDATCNPYLVFALLIHAGLDGVDRAAKLRAPAQASSRRPELLPQSLGEALECAEASPFVRKYIPPVQLVKFGEMKRREIANAESAGIEAMRKAYRDC